MNYYNNQMPPRYHKKHHYFLITLGIIACLAIGAGGAYLIDPIQNNNQTQQSSQRADSTSHKSTAHHNTSHKFSNGDNTTQSSHQASQSVNRPGYTLTVFPKSMQGTWYSLDKYSDGEGKKLDKLVITKNKISFDGNDAEDLHSRSLKTDAPNKANNEDKNWIVAVNGKGRGVPLVNVRGWSQGAGDGDDFNLLSVNGMEVLALGGGAGDEIDANYFQSPAQAKKFANKTFHHEKRDDV